MGTQLKRQIRAMQGNRCHRVCIGVEVGSPSIQSNPRQSFKARTKESRRKGIKGTCPGRNALFIMQLEWGFWPQSQSLWDGDPSVLSMLVFSTITSHRPLHKMVDTLCSMCSHIFWPQEMSSILRGHSNHTPSTLYPHSVRRVLRDNLVPQGLEESSGQVLRRGFHGRVLLKNSHIRNHITGGPESWLRPESACLKP